MSSSVANTPGTAPGASPDATPRSSAAPTSAGTTRHRNPRRPRRQQCPSRWHRPRSTPARTTSTPRRTTRRTPADPTPCRTTRRTTRRSPVDPTPRRTTRRSPADPAPSTGAGAHAGRRGDSSTHRSSGRGNSCRRRTPAIVRKSRTRNGPPTSPTRHRRILRMRAHQHMTACPPSDPIAARTVHRRRTATTDRIKQVAPVDLPWPPKSLLFPLLKNGIWFVAFDLKPGWLPHPARRLMTPHAPAAPACHQLCMVPSSRRFTGSDAG
jgi:hypothetical protein